MELTPRQRRIIEQVVNVFETGTPAGDYANLSIFEDGPNSVRQITYGRSQTTEYGKLRDLIRMYVAAGGLYSQALAPYLPRIGHESLVDEDRFKELLVRAGREDAVMRKTQDRFFDELYFRPAIAWADDNGFVLPLSGLVVYDSFIHSGAILKTLLDKLAMPLPGEGGDEPEWIAGYVKTRHQWLATHYRPIVRKTTYRTSCLLCEIERGNWNLDLLPVVVKNVPVFGD